MNLVEILIDLIKVLEFLSLSKTDDQMFIWIDKLKSIDNGPSACLAGFALA